MNLQEACRVLRISPCELSQVAVNKHYKLRCLEAHPDRGGTAAHFLKVKGAKEFLIEHLSVQTQGRDIVPNLGGMGFILRYISDSVIIRKRFEATYEQAMSASILPFNFNDDTYAVPLWEPMSLFYIKGGLFLASVTVKLPGNISTETDNTIVFHMTQRVEDLLAADTLSFQIGFMSYYVPLNAIKVKPRQLLKVTDFGLPRSGNMGEDKGIVQRAPIFLSLNII